ncbi:hypothetical protein Mcup_1861 [Metallosphaera cuprina Ar-4]|uniref:Uncharacterized protein n=1 Tax=Metallosphaera cuprina (strain Ar-4) TaxID=1006006 RepID=F4G176_METCR|nr:hypothetical protein Mcup_1861 [Metallosphaera cuprina Ar-4]
MYASTATFLPLISVKVKSLLISETRSDKSTPIPFHLDMLSF